MEISVGGHNMKNSLKYLWRILVILLVNVLIIALVGNYGGSVQTLSKVGSTGEEVRQIQTKLKEYGVYSGEVDGIYGSQTKKGRNRLPKIQRSCSGWNCWRANTPQDGDFLRSWTRRIQQQ